VLDQRKKRQGALNAGSGPSCQTLGFGTLQNWEVSLRGKEGIKAMVGRSKIVVVVSKEQQWVIRWSPQSHRGRLYEE